MNAHHLLYWCKQTQFLQEQHNHFNTIHVLLWDPAYWQLLQIIGFLKSVPLLSILFVAGLPRARLYTDALIKGVDGNVVELHSSGTLNSGWLYANQNIDALN